jgi:hypothetical protein
VDQFNPRHPVHQELVWGTVQEARERFGDGNVITLTPAVAPMGG